MIIACEVNTGVFKGKETLSLEDRQAGEIEAHKEERWDLGAGILVFLSFFCSQDTYRNRPPIFSNHNTTSHGKVQDSSNPPPRTLQKIVTDRSCKFNYTHIMEMKEVIGGRSYQNNNKILFSNYHQSNSSLMQNCI